MDMKGKRVLVVGMARSGVAAAKLLAQQGAAVTVNDMKTEEAFGGALDELRALGCRFALGCAPQPPRMDTFMVNAVFEEPVIRAMDGDIILLHDMSASSVLAALDIIDSLEKEGFRFVTVSELAKIRGVRLKPGVTYTSFPPAEDVK